MKRIMHKSLSVLMALVMVSGFVMLPPAAASAAEPVTLAAWNATTLVAAPSHPATAGTGILSQSRGGNINYSSSAYNAGTSGSWNWNPDGAYWQLDGMSSAGHENLVLTLNARSSGTGPRDFKVYYSVNGSNYLPATGNDVDYVTGNAVLINNNEINLPTSASDAETLSIRLVNVTNISVRAGTTSGSTTYAADEAIASGGTSQIQNIRLTADVIDNGSGTELTDPEPDPEPEPEPADPPVEPDPEDSYDLYDSVLINQVFGGGGSTTKSYRNCFVELYNPTDNPIDMQGWTIQYASATGAFSNRSAPFPAGSIIQPNGYYLIKLGAGNSGNGALDDFWPGEDFDGGALNIAAAVNKVILANNNTQVTYSGTGAIGIDAAFTTDNVVDFVTAGNSVNIFYESKNSLSVNATSSLIRKTDNDGKPINSNDHSLDFAVLSLSEGRVPRNSSYQPNNGTDPVDPPDEPDPEPGVITIAEARALGTGGSVIVEGVVTRAIQSSGTNTTSCTLYIQDDTAGIAVFKSGIALNTYEVGAKVKVTGTLSVYTGVLQVGTGTVIEEPDVPPAPRTPEVITIAQLNSGAFEGRLVKVEGARISSIATNSNHSIADPATGLETTMRATFATTLPAGYAVDDYIDVTGIAANFNGAPQLMVSVAGDITKAEPPKPPAGFDGTGVIAGWQIDSYTGSLTSINATGGDYQQASYLQFIKNGTPQSLNYSSGGANLSGLNDSANNAWWFATLTGTGFGNIGVSWNMRSSATGPRDFKLQYSTNGNDWIDANDAAFTVPSAVAIGNTSYTKSLPDEANNTDTLYIRWLMVSNVSAGGGTVGSGGTHQINNIVISGDYLLAENQLRRPSADIEGGEVANGQVLTFTPGSPEDAQVPGYAVEVRISADGGETWSDWTKIGADLKYTLDTLPVILEARAVADGFEPSRTVSYSFDPAKLSRVTARRNYGGTEVTLSHDVDGVQIWYTVKTAGNGEETADILYTAPIKLNPLLSYEVTAWAIKEGWGNSPEAMFIFDPVTTGGEQIYFGQIHTHTNLSDGQGTVAEAFDWAKNEAGLDFFAVTDHSNSFTSTATEEGGDFADGKDINAYNKNNASWIAGQDAAAAAFVPGEFISFYGYEMTWSGGPGHINTFNTEGFVSRNNTLLNAKTSDAGMRLYYELLQNTPGSISMFNHPGTTFGNFTNFAYHNPVIDQYITLLEVGNGEGAIGSGGYWRSYEQYTMALDKGWHVAPANNQDNHLRVWGNSNTARTAIWTNDFTLEGIYNALRDMRVYATEVADLEITYFVNGEPLGSIISEVPGIATFSVNIKNPTSGNTVKSVSLVTNGGQEIAVASPGTQNFATEYVIDTPAPGYYYLKAVVATPQGDRIAVTAPVWLGAGKAAGISEVACDTIMPVTGEPVKLTTSMFNNEKYYVTLKSIKYEARGTVLDERGNLNIVIGAGGGTYTDELTYTFTTAGETTVTVTAVIDVGGQPMTFTGIITFDVWDSDGLAYIGIDGSHYNEYVSGNYKDNMTNFTDVAASYGVRVNILNTEAELIAAAANPQYKMLILTAPSRRLYQNPAQCLDYSAGAMDAVAAFAQKGGTVVVTGWNNMYENYAGLAGMELERLMSSQQNQILASIGSTLRLGRDGAADAIDPYWPGAANAPNRLFPAGIHNAYNYANPLLATVDPKQQFSQYGGTTVYAVDPAQSGVWNAPAASTLPESVSKAVSLPEGCRSIDNSGVHDSLPKIATREYDGQYMILATETITHSDGTKSQVVVAGGAFMSNFEIRNSSVDNISDLYSNQNIVINLIQSIMEVSDIADVKTLDEGTIVTVEGIVTSNVHNGADQAANTGFFDCIYIQAASGGINLFPVSSGVEIGQTVRVTGTVSSYQGETQIQVRSLTVIDAGINPVAPTPLSTQEAMSPENTGLLVKVEGVVSGIKAEGGEISQFTVTDSSGAGAVIFINAYITNTVDLSFVKDGAFVSVIGLASVGETDDGIGPRIRVRDRNEIEFVADAADVTVTETILSAEIEKINANENKLTIMIKEIFSDGSQKMISEEFRIRNNAAGYFEVGSYKVYADTQGNTKIRDIYIIYT